MNDYIVRYRKRDNKDAIMSALIEARDDDHAEQVLEECFTDFTPYIIISTKRADV